MNRNRTDIVEAAIAGVLVLLVLIIYALSLI